MDADALIHSLIARLGNKLSHSAGARLETIEANPLVQQTVRSLIDLSQYKIDVTVSTLLRLLDTGAKIFSSANDDNHSPELHYSHLFLLRVIAACLNRHWNFCRESHYSNLTPRSSMTFVREGDRNSIDSGGENYKAKGGENGLQPGNRSARSSQFSQDLLGQADDDPPPLPDNISVYMMKIIFQFFSQTALGELGESTLSIETPSKHRSTSPNGTGKDTRNALRGFSRANADLKSGIQQAAGQILFYLSASNWSIVFQRLSMRMSILANTNDENMDLGDLRYLEWCNLNEKRLSMIFQELNVVFLQFKRSTQFSMAIVLRKTIWNWIEVRPMRFIELCRSHKRLEGGPEILFDICNSLSDNARRKAVFWPLQVMLLILCPDILTTVIRGEGNASKKVQFFDSLRKALKSSRLAEVAAIAYVDICKACTYVYDLETAALKQIIPEIESELKEKLFDPLKPFLNADGVIDQKLMTDCLTAFFKLNVGNAMQSLIPICLRESSPMAFRLVLVKSCLNIASDEEVSSNPAIAPMYSNLAGPLRQLFMSNLCLDRAEFRKVNNIMDKKAKKIQQVKMEEINEKLEILMNVLRVYRSDPMLAIMGHSPETQHKENFQLIHNITMCLKDPNLIIRTCAAEALLVLHDPNLISKWGPESTMIESFWSISSTVLIDISRQILDYKERDEGIRYFAEVLLQLLIRRIEFLQLHKDEIHKGLNIKERATSLVAVEIALLVLLCSPDAEICTMATNSFGQLCIECTLTQQYIDTSSSSVTFADNLEVYRELVHAGVLITGKVAQQKSIRKTLRLIQKQTPGNLAAWEEVYKRWKALKSIATRSPEETPVDFFEPVVKKKNNFFKSNHTPTQGSAVVQQDNREELVEWQNYTGFLCSLGGCCAIDDSKNPNHDSGKDHSSAQDTMKSKQIGNDSSSMVNRFISEMVELLLCDNALARETVKELLGSELSPILYGALFRHLEEIISKFFGSEGEVICNNNYTMFVEQAISVLKLILDRLQDNAEYLFTVDLDMGNLLLSFARYLHNLGTGSTALRVKVKMCQLTEVLMQKREIVSLRQEFQFRNKMLRILSEWTSDFNSNTSNPQYDEQSEKLHRDLDLSCMKTVVLLLDGLPLQPEDTKNEVDRQQAKSRLFYTYFSNFLKLLNRCRVLESLETGAHSLSENADVQMLLSKSKESFKDLGPLKDFTILALSNLLSANIESGLKYSLSMGYHEDTKTRSAFMQVLTNILKQGTEFESLAESSVNDRFKKIIAVLCDSNLSITTSLCDVCPVQDVDDLGTVLLNVFDSCNMTAPLLKAVIEREIAKTESSPELFRRNSMATRLLASFAKLYGDQYLRVTLQPLLVEMTTTKKSYEVDPSKLGPSSDAEANLQNLKEMCQKFLDSIIESTNLMPASLREICNYLSTVVVKKFPEANTTSVGGLIYLRFFCPALVAPDIHGLVDMITDKEVRRGLLLITKVIQNLANNVLFGAKEAFMISLNDLLNSYIPKVTKYLEDISAPLPINTNVVGGLVSKLSETDLNKLHHYLVDNIERIGRDIATRKSHSPYPLTQPIDQPAEVEKCRASAKVFYYKMSTLLAQLGPPVDLKKKREMMGINSKNANTNEAFRAFMDKHRYRNINPIKDKKIFYEGGYTREGKPLFYYIARRMIAESLDIESVMVYILQVLEPYVHKPFDVFVDITQFGPNNEVPLQFLNQFLSIIPTEVYSSLGSLYLYNVNTYFQKYTKQIGKTVPNKMIKKFVFPTNLNEVYEIISHSECRLPKATIALETDKGVIFSPVTCIIQNKVQLPSIIKVYHETIQITMLKKQEIFGLSAYFNDVYHISEIDEASIGSYKDEHCLILKYERGASSMSFMCSKVDLICKAIRNAKARYQLSKPNNVMERVIRPDNVPGTLLNMALLNSGSEDSNLRLASYNMLFALTATFNFDAGNQLLIAKDLCIPSNNTSFVMKISERLAATEPHLTFEFLSECFVGFKNSTTNLKHLCLEYMAPWLSNLTYLSRSIDQDGKGSQAKTKQLLSMMFDLTVKEVDMAPSIQSKIWRTIAQVDDLIDLVLDTIVLYAVEHGVGSVQAETLADTIVTLSAVNVRAGKLISRLRKLISKTAVVPKRNLTDHASWPEVAVLVRFNLMLSFNNRFIAQHYLPELFHIISILVATDHPIIRTSVHGLVINVIQSLCTCLPPNSPNLKTLSILLAEFSEPKFRLLFGLNRNMVNTVSRANEGSMDTHDLMPLNSLETIVHTLLDVMSYGSTSIDQSNIWRARWMSLVTSTAFQFNPAVQPRAFIVLGCLARGEVDDDLLYQILIALRGALELFDDTDCSLIVSIVLCLSNIAENLPGDSIYLQPMFWLGTAFIQIGHRPLFPSAIGLIEVVINKMRSHGLFTNTDLGAVLMKAREPFHQVSDQLDSCTGVKFAVDFPFALSTLLLKGLKHSATKTATQNVFTTLLDISTKSAPRQSHMSPQVLGFLSPMLPTAAKNLELKELLQSVGLDDVPVDNSELTRTYHKIFDRLGVADRTKALLLVSQMVGILQHAEFEAEILFLYGFFAEVAQTMPDIFVMVQDRLVPKMNQVLNSNQTAAIIDAVQSILYTVISNPYFQTRAAKPRNVSNILTELGFSTLLDCATWPDYPKDKLLRNAKLVSMLVESIVG